MSALGLLRVCEAIGSIDRGQIRDHGEALRWLAATLHQHCGAAVALWLVDLVGGELDGAEESPVQVAQSPGVPAAGSIPLRELTFFGELADVRTQATFLESIHDGPRTCTDFTLEAGERALLFRVRLDFALCWVRVTGPTALLSDLTPWRNLLLPALHGFLRGIDHDRRARFRVRQDQFFRTLLDTTPREPSEVFGTLCQAWHKFSGSLWAWLWLYNPLTKMFELTASASDKGIDHPDDRPAGTERPTSSSVAAYAALLKRVIPVHDAGRWQQTHAGQEYRTAIPEVMERMGGKAFICVPIIAPGSAMHAAMVNSDIRGTVCLHFPQLAGMPSMPFAGLERMGQATAQAIVNSFMSRYHDILVQLNDMAGRFLTREGSKPAVDREEYLKELIVLIQNRLHFRMVSVFYRVPFQDAVECLASTGICKREGEGVPISKAKLTEVRYRANEGRTGTCFATCWPQVFSEVDLQPGPAYGLSYEVNPDTKQRGHPFVVYPIPDSAAGTNARRAVGVIRCVSQDLLRNRFLQVELDPLEFIARQVNFVLQAFETRIRREQTISIVKHDLHAPLNMIRDTVDKMRGDTETGQPLGEYDLPDLETSAFFASNLVAQLDLSPGRLGNFVPEPTYLEGDILARVVSMLRRYAWEQRRMQIKFDNIRVIPRLNVDRSMIERAIQNLLVNAIKYGERKSTILVEGRKTTAGFCLDIKNEGIGIEWDEVRLIGQPNYRSPAAMKKAMGLGLGVFIARSVMLKHNGKLFLTQAKDPTTFSLFFPVQLAG